MKKQRIVKLNDQGFSLIEMMIVIALIGFIGTLVLNRVSSSYNQAKVNGAKIKIRQLSAILEDYKRTCGALPTMDQGLKALVEKPTGGKECKNYPIEAFVDKKNVNSVLKDPWDNEYDYKSDGMKYELISFGDDGQPGGEGYAKDLSSNDAD
ncbi:MAG: type II secretion system major pseudopilin GspG [Xanthomonadaceae bacterium]|nr:type II secretion system major pseudopilin GspG [Xanthomonadaceae bacterium]